MPCECMTLCLYYLYLIIFLFYFFLEQSLERQVLRDQCRRLEAQNYNLSLTAEQLSHSMGVRHTHTHTYMIPVIDIIMSSWMIVIFRPAHYVAHFQIICTC